MIAVARRDGGEAALLERLRSRPRCSSSTTASTSATPQPRSWSVCWTRRPRCGSSRRARSRSTSRVRSSHGSRRSPRRRRRALHAARRAARRRPSATPPVPRRSTGSRSRSSSPRLAQDALRRGDLASPGRPLQRPERPDEPQAGAPARAEGDDRVELRPAVPRRQARAVGAGDVRRRRPAARGGVGARGARRPVARRRSTSWEDSPSRSLVIVDGRPRTGCSTASARSRSRRWATAERARARGSRRVVCRGGEPVDGRRAQCPSARVPGVCARRAREHRRRARVGRLARSVSARLAIARGFGWAWIVLGDHRGAAAAARRAGGGRRVGPGRGPRGCAAARRSGSRLRWGTSSAHGATSPRRRRWPASRSSRHAARTTSPTSSRIAASGSTRWS